MAGPSPESFLVVTIPEWFLARSRGPVGSGLATHCLQILPIERCCGQVDCMAFLFLCTNSSTSCLHLHFEASLQPQSIFDTSLHVAPFDSLPLPSPFSAALAESIHDLVHMLVHTSAVLRREPTMGNDRLHFRVALAVVPIAGRPIPVFPIHWCPNFPVLGPNILRVP